MVPRGLVFLAVFLMPPWYLRAEPELKIADVPDSKIEYLQEVVAPSASCAAVSEVANVLVIGHKKSKDVPPFLTIYRLDDLGRPNAAPVTLNLPPRPASLAGNPHYPLYLLPHPKLPLLYVWMDAEWVKPDPIGEPPAVFNDLDHLLIYRIDKALPELVKSLARGPEYYPGNLGGSLCLSANGNRLYVPNLRELGKKPKPPEGWSVGYFQLDAQGLPMNTDEPKPDPAKPVRPARMTADGNYALSYWHSGIGFVPVADDVIIIGGPYGPVTWDDTDKRPKFNFLNFHAGIAAYGVDRIAGHPTLPVVYGAWQATGQCGRAEHADGWFTLAPQVAVLDNASFKSYPIVMEKHKAVAFGGVEKVYIVGLDEKGRLKNERIQAAVTSPSVEAIVYSPKFDRLYVAVEKGK